MTTNSQIATIPGGAIQGLSSAGPITNGRPMNEHGRDLGSPYFVQSLAKGLSVLTVFTNDRTSMSVSQIASLTGMSRASTRRVLLTLRDLGYVRSDGQEFFLTPKVLDLGYSYLSSMPLADKALPFMKEVVDTVQESCSVSVLDGDDIVYIARVPMRRIMTVQIHIGTRFPAYATSMGRVFLAHAEERWLQAYFERISMQQLTPHTVHDPAELREVLLRVRRQGYANVSQEMELGLASVAVPIWDRKASSVVAAMNVSAPALRSGDDFLLRTALPALQSAASKVSGVLDAPASAAHQTSSITPPQT